MSPETVLVTIFFLMPGLISLSVFEWIVVGRERSALELTTLALSLSLLAAGPLVAIPQTRAFVEYLWDPSNLSAQALGGVGLQTLLGIALAASVGLLAKAKGTFGPKSVYQRSWDWMWGSFGGEQRYLIVRTVDTLYYGELAFADDPSVGQDLVLKNPGTWDEEKSDFYRSGMKYVLIPGKLIQHVEVSVADPVIASDYPFYLPGYAENASPIKKETRHE